jgi:UDP-N-acetylmuramoylalanine--D-glutamate ligase
MSAALAAFLYGVSPEVIRGAVGTFGGLPHRLEHVCSSGGVTYINDSKATTPESVVTAVDALSGPYAVILGGSSKGVSYDGLATCLARDSRLVVAVVIGATGPAIEDALRRAGLHGDRIVQAASLEEAVEHGANLLVRGGTLLLSPACASFDMFRDFEERGDVFKEIVLRRCAAAAQ